MSVGTRLLGDAKVRNFPPRPHLTSSLTSTISQGRYRVDLDTKSKMTDLTDKA